MSAQDEELDELVQRVAAPYGGAADRRAADRALDSLLEHSDAAHPKLLALLGPHRSNPVTVINLLPQFGRPESVPVLVELLASSRENVRMAAANALARHPLPVGRTAMEQALFAADPRVVGAAADGLRLRADPSACAALLRQLDHSDPTARHAILLASVVLGCLSRAELARRVRTDPDPEIRALVDIE